MSADRDLYYYSQDFPGYLHGSGRVVNRGSPVDLATRYGHFESGEWFFVLDCEGTADRRVRQLGGLICMRMGVHMVVVEDFILDGRLVMSGLSRAYAHIREYSGRKRFRAFTFGTQDSYMLRNTFSSKVLLNRLDFVDVSGLSGMPCGRQHKVAEALNACVHLPKHDALNDARTLFNILAVYQYETGGMGDGCNKAQGGR